MVAYFDLDRTLLPNGQVLLMGGMVAGSDSSVIKLNTSNETAYATVDELDLGIDALALLLEPAQGLAQQLLCLGVLAGLLQEFEIASIMSLASEKKDLLVIDDLRT